MHIALKEKLAPHVEQQPSLYHQDKYRRRHVKKKKVFVLFFFLGKKKR